MLSIAFGDFMKLGTLGDFMKPIAFGGFVKLDLRASLGASASTFHRFATYIS